MPVKTNGDSNPVRIDWAAVYDETLIIVELKHKKTPKIALNQIYINNYGNVMYTHENVKNIKITKILCIGLSFRHAGKTGRIKVSFEHKLHKTVECYKSTVAEFRRATTITTTINRPT